VPKGIRVTIEEKDDKRANEKTRWCFGQNTQ
jgi:hypothetical protein